MDKEYNKITVLSELEHIRQRPGMYIGDTETPLHLIYEVIDNALDEANAGYATQIDVELTEQSCTVQDNGRGIPIHNVPELNVPAPVAVCIKLFSGAKFDNISRAYDYSIGLNGVGLVAVNALSEKMYLSTSRDNIKFDVFFDKGTPQNYLQLNTDIKSGTSVTFYPSRDVFLSNSPITCINQVTNRLRLALTFIKNLNISLNGKKLTKFEYNDLVNQYVDTPIAVMKSDRNDMLVVGYITSSTYEDLNNGSVNLLPVNKGSHITVARNIIVNSWSHYIKNSIIKPQDVLIGCSSYFNIFSNNPQFTSQTKDTLASSVKIDQTVINEFTKNLSNFWQRHEKIRLILLKKFEEYRESINRLSSTNYLESKLIYGDVNEDNVSRRLSIPKLIDCSSTKRSETELFIVEGESAAGSLKTSRNPKIHAILPLRGKILNVIDRKIQDIMDNDEIRSLINGIGCGAYGKTNISKIRYGKIIIMSDADPDGKNIQALLIGLFNYCMPEVISNGYLYIINPPLFGKYEKNKFIPIYTDNPNSKEQRFKGLGEMNPNEIKEVAFNTNTRRLIHVFNPDKEVTRLVNGSYLKKKLLIEQGLITA